MSAVNYRTTRRALRGRGGVSLVEIMVGMTISVMMMAAISMAVQTQNRSSARETMRVDMTHALQNTMLLMERDLRMTGYLSGTSCVDCEAGSISTADQTSITIVYDTDDDGDREAVTFRRDQAGDAGYDADHPRMLRIDAGGAIFPLAANITGLSIQYFDSAGTQIADAAINTSTGTQTNRDTIRSVRVTVSARSARSTTGPGAGFMTDSLTFRVTPRNYIT